MEEKFTFFWDGPFSQWSRSPFVIDGIIFKTAEHYMMWSKDQIFSGGKLSDQILSSPSPGDVKRLGRQVENFDPRIWNAVAKTIVFRGSIAKFTQNPKHNDALFCTKGSTLVEASPNDSIWGIGLYKDDPRCLKRETWNGTNWLGETLTNVREVLFTDFTH